MKGDRGREPAAFRVKVVRAFGVVELPAFGLDSSVKFCVLHCYMFYLFDATKVVNFLPFTKCFCNYFCFHHYFFLFTLLYRRTAAPLHLCKLSYCTMGPAAPDRAELTHQPPPPPRHLWAGVSSGHGVGIYPTSSCRGGGQTASVRRTVLLVNQSCRASLMNAIALIINYLGVPLGRDFTWLCIG